MEKNKVEKVKKINNKKKYSRLILTLAASHTNINPFYVLILTSDFFIEKIFKCWLFVCLKS